MTLRDALFHQSRVCAGLGSPFTGRVLGLLAKRFQAGTGLTDRLFIWPGNISASGASVPLRLAGALHGLVLGGTTPALSALYPPNNAPDDDTLWAAIDTALTTHAVRIDNWLDRPPQTNEVGRSAMLIAALHWLTAQTGLPLVLSELGASAGLNLMCDRFALKIGDKTFGPANPALTLRPKWTGDRPTPGAIEIADRRGTDLTPLNPRDPDDALQLMAYIWPDQPDRLNRTRAAITVAEAQVDTADAADWLRPRLATPRPGTAHLIYHTIAWQYFPRDVQAKAQNLIEAAGHRATPDSPLAWFGMEADGNTPGAGLTLRLWPGDRRLTLGRGDYHGSWVDWRPQER